MDRLANYESWRTIALPGDEVPVSHTLVGFATALDMVYERLDEDRRQLYVSKVLNVTHELYDFSFTKWWGVTLLQVRSYFFSLNFAGIVILNPIGN